MMKIQFRCPTCRSLTAEKLLEDWIIKPEAHCRKLHSIPLKFSDSLKNEEFWDQCPACNSFHVFIEKKVPKKIFLSVLIFGLLISFYLLSIRLLYGIACLTTLSVIDAILYQLLPNRLVCYRCGSFGTKFPQNPNYHPFDHHVAESTKSRTSSRKM
jgi:hypothetical protein